MLARKTTLTLDAPLSAAQLLKASHAQNHHSFHFLLALDSRHSFMGSTPERLYLRHGQNLETEALAGTIGRGANATQDMELAHWLTHDSKNLNENQLVVEDIIESLAPHAEQIHTQREAQLVRLRKVQHLKNALMRSLNLGSMACSYWAYYNLPPRLRVYLVKRHWLSSRKMSLLHAAGTQAPWVTLAMRKPSFVWRSAVL